MMNVSFTKLQATFVLCIIFLGVVAAQDSTPSDFLRDHVPIYVGIVIGIFMIQSIVLKLMGQPFLPPSSLVCWYGDTEGPGNSQHIADWYTFTHILHGFIFFFITYWLGVWIPEVTVNYSYIIALATAATWEITENTPCIVNRYRQTAIAAGYIGDSVVNSFCDSVACTLGFWISYFLPWWSILIMAILEELLLAIIIRDNLIINIIQIVFSFKLISDWQAAKTRDRVNTSDTADDKGGV